MPRPEKRLDAFTTAYIEAALWSTTDNSDEQGGEPLDANYTVADIAPPTLEAMKRDCADFQQRFGQLVEGDESPAIEKWGRWELAGHDFWLTRNNHGAGFGDGNFPKHDDELYEAAHSYGDFELYVGDDNIIYAVGHESEVNETPHRAGGRYPKPQRPRPQFIQPQVRDFETRQDIVEHELKNGATHVLVVGSGATLYYPFQTAGGRVQQYEENRTWRQHGYWHSRAPGDRAVVDRLPAGAEPIESYLARAGGRKAAEVPRRGRGHAVRDYVPVDSRGRPLSGPTKDYDAAKRQADQAGGVVKFTTGRPPAMEAFGRQRAWPDWQILDAIGRGQQVPPESEARAAKLAQLGFIDTTGTWRLTAKGRQAIDQRVPVAAESGRHWDKGPPSNRHLPRKPKMTDAAVKDLAGELAVETGGTVPKPIPGGFRWSEPNVSAQFTTSSPEYGQKVVCVVSIFGDNSTAIKIFSDESLSATAEYENIGHFTYAGTDVPEMVKDINWVRATVDGYAASWQQDDAGAVDESRRARARRSTPSRRRSTRRPSTRR